MHEFGELASRRGVESEVVGCRDRISSAMVEAIDEVIPSSVFFAYSMQFWFGMSVATMLFALMAGEQPVATSGCRPVRLEHHRTVHLRAAAVGLPA